MHQKKNIIGPQVRKLRVNSGLTQEQLTARCGVVGFDISRATLSHIEAQLRGVSDLELVLLSKSLRVNVSALLPRSLPPWHPTDRSGKKKKRGTS